MINLRNGYLQLQRFHRELIGLRDFSSTEEVRSRDVIRGRELLQVVRDTCTYFQLLLHSLKNSEGQRK